LKLVVSAMRPGVSAPIEFQPDIPGSGAMPGRFRSVKTAIRNWAGNIFRRRKVFMGLCSRCCVKMTTGLVKILPLTGLLLTHLKTYQNESRADFISLKDGLAKGRLETKINHPRFF